MTWSHRRGLCGCCGEDGTAVGLGTAAAAGTAVVVGTAAAAAAVRTAAAAVVGTAAAAAAETAADAETAGTAAETVAGTAAAGRAGTGSAVLDCGLALAIPGAFGLEVEAGTEAGDILEGARTAERCPGSHSAEAVGLKPIEAEPGLKLTSEAGSAGPSVEEPPGLEVC